MRRKRKLRLLRPLGKTQLPLKKLEDGRSLEIIRTSSEKKALNSCGKAKHVPTSDKKKGKGPTLAEPATKSHVTPRPPWTLNMPEKKEKSRSSARREKFGSCHSERGAAPAGSIEEPQLSHGEEKNRRLRHRPGELRAGEVLHRERTPIEVRHATKKAAWGKKPPRHVHKKKRLMLDNAGERPENRKSTFCRWLEQNALHDGKWGRKSGSA